MSGKKPLAKRRGMDARWWEERGHWSAAQVAASCEQVALAFSRTEGMHRRVYGAFDSDIAFGDEDAWERTIVVYQLRGHKWTLLESIGNRIVWDIAENLSKKLSTQALVHAFSDTAGVYGYELWENGRLLEEFSWGDTPEFCDANRDEKIAEGWILSDDNYRQFRSKRLQRVDMNAADALDLPDRTATDLGLYIPCDVWDVSDNGVALSPPWSKQDIHDAKIVLSDW